MKPGCRALGIAESYRATRSTLAGAVVTASGRADGFAFATCTVGGSDATDAILELWEAIDRADIRYCFLSGIALAWFNLVDLDRLGSAISVPVIAITYEESDGLAASIRDEFPADEAEERLDQYRSLPDRERITVNDATVFVRTKNAGATEVPAVLDAFTQEGARPEPVRVASSAARAADAWRRMDRSR